ncbi:MAG: type IV secretory system conjugative DNA transfer family protein [Bacilli bacterium]|nr:type IV secretory system conjugative DNA transfer family protein [Bacilli bacterium]
MKKNKIILFSCLAVLSMGLAAVSTAGVTHKAVGKTIQAKAETEFVNVGRIEKDVLKRSENGNKNFIYGHINGKVEGYPASWALNLDAVAGSGYILKDGADITGTIAFRYTDLVAGDTVSRFWLDVPDGDIPDGTTYVVGGKFTRTDGMAINITRSAFRFNALSGNWSSIYDDEDLEDYAKATIRDVAKYDSYSLRDVQTIDHTGINGETKYYTDSNSTNSVAFSFTYKVQGAKDGTTTDMFFRTPSNNGWFGYKICIMNQWGQSGNAVVWCGQNEPGDITTKYGEFEIPAFNETVTLEVDVINLKHQAGKVWYAVRMNGDVKYQTVVNDVASFDSNHVTFYTRTVAAGDGIDIGSVGDSSSIISIGKANIIPVGSTSHIYFSALGANNSLVPYETDWSLKSYALNGTFTKNGVPFTPSEVVKHEQNLYWFQGFGEPVAGDTIVFGGTFKSSANNGQKVVWKVEESTFRFDGTKWTNVGLYDLVDSTEEAVPADSYLRNIGTWKPDHSGHAVKNFDQTPDTLVYKKDAKNNTGLYFTSSATGKNSEVRFYMPGNNYKTETKGYAVRSVSFDYILNDTNTVKGTEAGSTLENGYYGAKAEGTETSYMIQYMDKDSSSYFCFDVELVNDGDLHTLTLNVPYCDVSGFNVKLFKFNGNFFISNIVVDRDDYNEALDTLVHDSLKMYAYTTSSSTVSCETYYPAAKAAFNALSLEDKTTFTTSSVYAAALARLNAWAVANNDVVTSSGIHSVNALSNDGSVIYIVVAVMGLITLAGAMLYAKKRHN